MRMIPLTTELISTYNRVGTTSYCEHYLHLWTDNNPAQYIEKSFTPQVVDREIKDANLKHFLIEENGEVAGIIKLVNDAAVEGYTGQEALLLEKIYILKSHSGRGLGKKSISFVIDLTESMGKKVIWLCTMKKGRALEFYLDLGFEIFGEMLLAYPLVLDDQRPMYKLRYLLGSKS